MVYIETYNYNFGEDLIRRYNLKIENKLYYTRHTFENIRKFKDAIKISEDYFVVKNGKFVSDDEGINDDSLLSIIPKIVGG